MTGRDLVVDPVLREVWTEVALSGGAGEPGEPGLLGVAAASDGETGCVVAVTAEPVDPQSAPVTAAAVRMAAELGLAEVRLFPVHGPQLRTVVRDWLYQAAQGSGRGVRIELSEDGDDLQVQVSSWDSSAREVVLRLGGSGSGGGTETAALARVLGYRSVQVTAPPDGEGPAGG